MEVGSVDIRARPSGLVVILMNKILETLKTNLLNIKVFFKEAIKVL